MACSSRGCGPQLVWGLCRACHSPQREAEAEINIGAVIEKSHSREASSYEYVTIAKSLVMSTPDTRMGLMSSPYSLSRANATQEL